jgi:hypothetical protein
LDADAVAPCDYDGRGRIFTWRKSEKLRPRPKKSSSAVLGACGVEQRPAKNIL